MKIENDIHYDGPGAIYLSEYFLELNEGAGFLAALSEEDRKAVRKHGTRCSFAKGEGVFHQGTAHTGVWVIEEGRVRTFYTGPSGREITLAYWSPGHFVGGPKCLAAVAMSGLQMRLKIVRCCSCRGPACVS